MHHQYLLGTLLLVPFWITLYFYRPDLRRKILFSSLLCLPLGLSQPFYVPEYWNPQALLGFSISGYYFDIESLLYCFLIGGIAAGKYETVFRKHLEKINSEKSQRHRNRRILLVSLIISTLTAALAFEQFIWASLIGLFTGIIVLGITRRDLWKESLFGGLTYLIIHFILLLVIDPILYPGWISKIWNVTGILGYKVITIPLGEILFAFGFGALWAPIYEDIEGYEIKEN